MTSVVLDAPVVSAPPHTIVPPPAVQPAQAPGNAVRRIGGLSSPTAKIDGVDDELSVDIAVLDTGIDVDHPDLDVRGAVDCTTGRTAEDENGHGTLVGGFAAAVDNAIGRVGVAPGARLWSVRVFNKAGRGILSWVLCGVDWVTATRTDADPGNDVDVTNMSLNFNGSDTGKLRSCRQEARWRPVASGHLHVRCHRHHVCGVGRQRI